MEANDSRPLVLVTGANGQLGKELQQLEKKWPSFRFLFLSREDLPIHHFELVRNFFKASKPSVLINCAAYTAVDKAEQELVSSSGKCRGRWGACSRMRSQSMQVYSYFN